MIDFKDVEAINRAVAEFRDDVHVGENGCVIDSFVTYEPAEDIAQAWELLEEMKEAGMTAYNFFYRKDVRQELSCQITVYFGVTWNQCFDASTESAAICLSWLEWKKSLLL